MGARLHFSRFEFKYILPERVRTELEAELQYFIELDPYVSRQKDCKYFVRSLYYDNDPMSMYYEKIDGMMHRAKFRIRTYTDNHDEECAQFLEIKGRHNAQVFKHRAVLADAPRRDLARSGAPFDETTEDVLARLEEGSIKNQFLRDLYRKHLKPVVLIDYWRRPYISKYDPEFRLTFDESLACSVCNRVFPGPSTGKRSILLGYTVLEIKFRHHIPKWFHRLIGYYELRRVSISKYCAGVDAYGLVPKLE